MGRARTGAIAEVRVTTRRRYRKAKPLDVPRSAPTFPPITASGGLWGLYKVPLWPAFLGLILLLSLGSIHGLHAQEPGTPAAGGDAPAGVRIQPPVALIPTVGPSAVVQARKPEAKVREGGPAEVGIEQELAVDIRSPELWLETLNDRGIIKPDERDIKDPALIAERDRRRQEAAKLPEPQRSIQQEEINRWWSSEQDKRWLNAVEGYLRRLSLFIDDEAFADLQPYWVYAWPDEYAGSDPGQFSRTYTLHFRLRKTPENREKWMNLLRGQGLFDRPAVITVGFVDQWGKRVDVMPSEVAPHATQPWQQFRLETAPDKEVIGAIIVTVLLAILGLWLAISSDLLRDTCAPLSPSGRHPYSLGLCQLAFWLFLIGVAFLFLWVVTGERTLTSSELTLLGISATTGLGAALVNRALPPCQPSLLTGEEREDRDPSSLEKRVRAEEEAKAQAAAALADAQAAAAVAGAAPAGAGAAVPPVLAPLEKAVDIAGRRLVELKDRLRYYQSGGAIQQFFLDLLRERDSVSLHRFQMLAWTVCLGLVFAFSVLMRLEMPQFDSTLLLLVGISNGTYLGFKWPAAQS